MDTTDPGTHSLNLGQQRAEDAPVTRDDDQRPSPRRSATRAFHELRRSERWAFPAMLGATAAALAGLTLVLLIDPRASWAQGVGDVSETLAAYIATVACVRAARRGGEAARAWAVLAVGTGVWSAAVTIWTVYGFALDRNYPFPSIADIGFVGYALPVAVALLLFPRSGERTVSRVRVLLDWAVICVAVLFVSWATVLGPVYRAEASGLTRLVGLAYPLVDIVIASLVIALGVRAGRAVRRRWVLLGAGLLSLTVTDSIFASLTLQGHVGLTGTVLVVGWVAAFLLIALATCAPSGALSARRHFTVTQELLPYAPALAAILASARIDLTARDDDFLLSTGIALIVVVVLHQIVVALEKVTLANNLEDAVAARTAELADLARRNDLILNSAGDGIYGVDVDGRITFVNPAACDMLGYDPEELLGRNSHELFHRGTEDAHSHPAELCPVLVATHTGTAQRSADETFQRKDATLVHVEKVATPIEEGARVTGAVVSFRDITQRREVDRMKDEFTSVVSHELRTPLTSIRGSLGLLASGALGTMPQKGQRMLDIAVSNTDRLIRLVNDILDIERIESGAIVMERQWVPACELMARAREAMEATALEVDVHLELETAEAQLWVDPDRMMQTLTNLLANAIKFSERGATVRLRAECQDSEMRFSVIDTGRGIPPDRLDAIFERFQQVDSSDAREKGGTGLGLPICRSIVEQHGGRIWVESEPGHGSAFHFTVPASISTAAAKGTVREDAPAVLVCDDDPAVRDVVGALLEAGGYRALTAASGEEALELAATHRPVALLLDLLMPGLGGWETAARLKAQPETSDIPIVICSVLSPAETRLPVDAEVAGWIDKPVDEKSIMQALEGALFAPGGKSRVLVVEDDADLARVLTTMFQRHGLETFSAATGTEALRVSQQVLPDLLVLDVMLAESDGFAVIDWLRRHERLRTTPVVVYTAHDLDESQREQLRLGETHFFTKGRISPADFEQRVMGLLTRMTVSEETSVAQ